MDEQKVIESFHMMWDNFPDPVMLIKKSRDIYAVNKKAASSAPALAHRRNTRAVSAIRLPTTRRPLTKLTKAPLARPMASGFQWPVPRNTSFILV